MRRSDVRRCESLEARDVPALAALAGGVLTVTGTPGNDMIAVYQAGADLVVTDRGTEIGRFAASAAHNGIVIDGGAGDDRIRVASDVTVGVTLSGGGGRNKVRGGGGQSILTGGPGTDVLVGGNGQNTLTGGGGDKLYRVRPGDGVTLGPDDRVLRETNEPPPFGSLGVPQLTLTATEVDGLLKRAAAASASSDGIFVVVDRNGRILGVRAESGVDPAILTDPAKLTFAVDGAVAKARTGAFFGNNQAPLTSRTVQLISQSTITEREVNSDPSVIDPNSLVRGPGFVAAVGVKGHFPAGVAFTPQVDLFGIEHTNRDGTYHVGNDHIKGTADDVLLAERFHADPNFVLPGQELFPPDSYGFESYFGRGAQARGIATLPGGVPIYKYDDNGGQVVGGIGVFYPGKTGYATEENSALSSTFDPTKADRSLEAEWVAFAAVGGFNGESPVGTIGEAPPVPGINGLPFGAIDLVGIQLDIVGPGGAQNGRDAIRREGIAVGVGPMNDGRNLVVDAGADAMPNTADDIPLRDGKPVPEGWLVVPHAGVGISAAEVEQIVANGIAQAFDTRAAIRLPLGSRTRMVFAVADRNGDIVGLYRMADATVFSIDVAVAKARNVGYYADAGQLQDIDRVPGVPAGTAFTNRTFRYLALPRFPESVDGANPGAFSQLNDANVDPITGRNTGPVAASAYQSVYGYDSFNPGTNFRQRGNVLNQNGIVFFPGSAPLYRNGSLIGGFGVSGDGVDQDDVTTAGGQVGFEVPGDILRADQVTVLGVRLPYQKFNRNPEG